MHYPTVLDDLIEQKRLLIAENDSLREWGESFIEGLKLAIFRGAGHSELTEVVQTHEELFPRDNTLELPTHPESQE